MSLFLFKIFFSLFSDQRLSLRLTDWIVYGYPCHPFHAILGMVILHSEAYISSYCYIYKNSSQRWSHDSNAFVHLPELYYSLFFLLPEPLMSQIETTLFECTCKLSSVFLVVDSSGPMTDALFHPVLNGLY